MGGSVFFVVGRRGVNHTGIRCPGWIWDRVSIFYAITREQTLINPDRSIVRMMMMMMQRREVFPCSLSTTSGCGCVFVFLRWGWGCSVSPSATLGVFFLILFLIRRWVQGCTRGSSVAFFTDAHNRGKLLQ